MCWLDCGSLQNWYISLGNWYHVRVLLHFKAQKKL